MIILTLLTLFSLMLAMYSLGILVSSFYRLNESKRKFWLILALTCLSVTIAAAMFGLGIILTVEAACSRDFGLVWWPDGRCVVISDINTRG